jgi:hypothetical protein
LRRIANQNPQKPLYVEEHSFSDEDIVFSSMNQLLEFYYNGLVGNPKSVALESSPESQSDSLTFHSPILDVFATIGFYLEKLGRAEKLILAFFYGNRKTDQEIAQVLNMEKKRKYNKDGIKYIRLKQIRTLDKLFRSVGILVKRY